MKRSHEIHKEMTEKRIERMGLRNNLTLKEILKRKVMKNDLSEGSKTQTG